MEKKEDRGENSVEAVRTAHAVRASSPCVGVLSCILCVSLTSADVGQDLGSCADYIYYACCGVLGLVPGQVG